MQRSGDNLIEVELIDHGDGHFRLVVITPKTDSGHNDHASIQAERSQNRDNEYREAGS